MAARYWVGGSATWDATAGSKWSTTSGGAGGAAVPTSADDVYINASSGAGTVTLSNSSVCQSLICTGFTGTLTHPVSVTLTVHGSLTLASGMTYTKNTTSKITFAATTTGHTINTVSKTVPDIRFDGVGGGWTLAASLSQYSLASIFTLVNGDFSTAGYSLSMGSFVSTGTGTRSLTLGASTVTITPYSVSYAWRTTASLTLDAGTSHIKVIADNNTGLDYSGPYEFEGQGKTFYDVTFYLGELRSYATVSGSNTFRNLTLSDGASDGAYHGTGAPTLAEDNAEIEFVAGTTQTITGTLTISSIGNAELMRVSSSALSQTATLSAAAASFARARFEDITITGAAAPVSGTRLGDFGGNSGITFDASRTLYWVDTNGGNWSATTSWSLTSGGASGQATPLPQDDVVINASSITVGSSTITATERYLCRNLTMTGVLNSPTFTNTTSAPYFTRIFGNLTLATGVTYNAHTVLRGRGSHTLTRGGATVKYMVSIETVTGTYTLQDAWADTGTIDGGLELYGGTFDANDQTISVWWFDASYTDYDCVLNMGSGTWTLTGTGTLWDATTGSSLTLNAETSTISATNTSATAKTLNLGDKTYNTVTITGDNIRINNSNTITTLNVNNAGRTNGLKLTSGNIQTITNFTSNGSAGNLSKLVGSTSGSAASISKSSNIVSEDYLSIQDITATGGAIWYAGTNSVNVSGNSGWLFRVGVGPNAIASTTIGTPKLNQDIVPNGFTSTTIGTPYVVAEGVIAPGSIIATTTMGTPAITAGAVLTASSIASTTTFGVPMVLRYLASATNYSKIAKSRTSYIPSSKSGASYSKVTKNKTDYSRDR